METGKNAIYYILAVCCVIVCSQGNNFTLQPVDVSILIGQNASFQCGFTGDSPPLWDIFSSSGQFLDTLNDGENDHPYSYPSVGMSPAVINVIGSSNSVNNTCFQCRISRIGDSDIYSNMARLTVFGPPLAPPSVDVINTTFKSISFSWGEPWSHAPISHYVLVILNSDGTTVVDMATKQASAVREHTFDNLEENMVHLLRVSAVSEDAEGPFIQVQVSTVRSDLPPPPRDVMALVRIVSGDPEITVNWKAPEGLDPSTQSPISSYTIYSRDTSSGDVNQQEHDPSNNDLSTTLSDVVLGKTYTVEMTATNSGGESDRSDPCNVSANYIQVATVTPINNGVNVTCIFAVTDIPIQCRVTLTNLEGRIYRESSKVIMNSDPPTAIVIVMNLDSVQYNYQVQAVRNDDLVLESNTVNGSVRPISHGVTDPPLTHEQIGIIVGVVAGTFIVIICLLAIICVAMVFGDSICKPKFRKRKNKHRKSNGTSGHTLDNLDLRDVSVDLGSVVDNPDHLGTGNKDLTADTAYDV